MEQYLHRDIKDSRIHVEELIKVFPFFIIFIDKNLKSTTSSYATSPWKKQSMPSIAEEDGNNHYQLVDLTVLEFSDLTAQKFQDIKQMFRVQQRIIDKIQNDNANE